VEAVAALAALKSSGLPAAEFARRQGVDPQRLRAWERRLGASGSSTALSPAAAPPFIEVAPQGREPVEVVLRSGVVLRFAETIDPKALRRIAEALEDSARC
jgi:hypothetical protein